ncbi:MAG: nucleoside triphosphate pyrophosphohydrolase, partial [Ruminococcus sp.]|nr:nucleoside triphosphate pyrophosphohydrolase [Ruminococcus sp.]
MDFQFKDVYNISDLVQIMHILRAPDGCPWDKVQTHESIRQNFIEETYEAVEAIDKKDVPLLREELGDVLMQVIFHCIMEEEQGTFSFDDVCNEVCQKLIIRHPHVFGNI